MRLIQFGDVALPEANGRQSFKTTFRSSIIPLQGGGFDQDGSNTYLEPKTVSANFWVIDEELRAIDDIIDALYREATEGRQQLIAEKRDGTLFRCDAKLLTASVRESANVYFPNVIANQGDGYSTMQIEFEVEYPYWLSVADGEALKLNDLNLLNNNVYLNVALTDVRETITSTAHTFEIDNTGGAPVYAGTVTFEVTAGSVVDLRITNTTTDELLEYAAPLASGDTLVYDLLPMSAIVNDIDRYRFVVIGSTQMEFLHLDLGVNAFQVDGDFSAATVEMTFSWVKHYVR